MSVVCWLSVIVVRGVLMVRCFALFVVRWSTFVVGCFSALRFVSCCPKVVVVG